MNKLKLAILISEQAHKGQFDKGGKPYYLHPNCVASMCDKRVDKIVAYLHDVVEDTDITLRQLKECGFGRRIVKAIAAITHDKSVPYLQYLDIVKQNRIAKRVKIADLTHNSDINRIPNLTVADYKRCKQYETYIKYLLNN